MGEWVGSITDLERWFGILYGLMGLDGIGFYGCGIGFRWYRMGCGWVGMRLKGSGLG